MNKILYPLHAKMEEVASRIMELHPELTLKDVACYLHDKSFHCKDWEKIVHVATQPSLWNGKPDDVNAVSEVFIGLEEVHRHNGTAQNKSFDLFVSIDKATEPVKYDWGWFSMTAGKSVLIRRFNARSSSKVIDRAIEEAVMFAQKSVPTLPDWTKYKDIDKQN